MLLGRISTYLVVNPWSTIGQRNLEFFPDSAFLSRFSGEDEMK